MPRVSRKPHLAATAEPPSPAVMRIYKTAIYVRLSLEDVRKKISDSIGTQKTMLMNHLQTQPDMELYEVYEDVNYTGINFNRPAFQRMIEDIHAGLVDCVLVKDLSRFGRSFEEMGHYLERVFPFLQVRFVSVNDNYDSLTASLDESSLMVPLKNLMNSIYSRDLSKKTRAGKRAKQQRGEFCGSFAPYGYIKEGPSLLLDNEAAPVVRLIFTWVLEGMSDAAIAQKLNEMCISSPSRHRFEKGLTKAKKHEKAQYWYKSTVKRISEYPVYTGTLVTGKYHSDSLRGGGISIKSQDECFIFENAHPAIVDSETFKAVQRIRQTRKQNYKQAAAGTRPSNLFKSLVFCGDCGKHMTRSTRKDKYTYVCFLYLGVNKNACTPKAIREADLQAAVFAYISREIRLSVDMVRLIETLQKRSSYQERQAALEKQVTALNGKLEQNRRFRGTLREDFKDGILTEQDYTTMKADYDNEKDNLQQELDSLLARKTMQNHTLSPENKWIAEFRRFETEETLSAPMASALVQSIKVYDGGRIEIDLRYRDELQGLQAYLSTFELGVG